jgi:hypothetical protein
VSGFGEKPPPVFGTSISDRLHTPPLPPTAIEKIQVSYAKLKRLVNLYPGMDLGEILDNPKLVAAEKARMVTERIAWIERLREQNPDVEFLKLDFSPDSQDVAALNFDGFSEIEQEMLTSTFKPYARIHSFTNYQVEHAATILASGYRSACGIVNAGFGAFIQATGFSETVGRGYYDAARNMTVTVGAGFGAILDYLWGGFNWLNVSNLKPRTQIQEVMEPGRLDDFESLFGNQTYCNCQHCQSIFSPAAYFVDLMYFLQTNHYEAAKRLRKIRPDLWTVELTCANTDTEIPTLDVINEILENYAFEWFRPFFRFVFMLTESSFQALRNEGVPEVQVLQHLSPIKNKVFSSKARFLTKVGNCIQPQDLVQYGDLLVKYAFSLECYKLTDDSFEKLKDANVPDPVLTKLQPLKNQKYYLSGFFKIAVAASLGPADTSTYLADITQSAITTENIPDLAAAQETIVFQMINDFTKLIPSFRRPLVPPIEKLQGYLAQFDLSRAAIARALDAAPEILVRNTFNLSLEQYRLITQTKAGDPGFLVGLYGISLAPDPARPGKIASFDVQDLLRPMGLSRSELEELIKTRFCLQGGVTIVPGKKPKESVQNNIERIYNLTPEILDRVHRFIRLWRQLPPMKAAPDGLRWTIAELDLVLALVGSTPSLIDDATLVSLVAVLALQERWSLSVAETCGLWCGNLTDVVLAGPQDSPSFFNRLFNLPAFGQPDNPFPRDASLFVHPAFLPADAPAPAEDALPRLRAGLQVNDEELYLLIVHLDKALGLDLHATPPKNGFYLNAQNITLLYRHARLAKLLKLTVPELFQAIELFSIMSGKKTGALIEGDDLMEFLEFYDRWPTSRFKFDDLGFFTRGTVLKPEAYPEAGELREQLLGKVQADKALEFADTVFAFLDGVTERQSRDIIAANSPPTAKIVEAVNPEKTAYRLTPAFSSATRLEIPDDVLKAVGQTRNISYPDVVKILTSETQIALLHYHARGVILINLAALLNISKEKTRALILMTEQDLFAPEFTLALQGDPKCQQSLFELIDEVLRLSVCFRNHTFDPTTLEFIWKTWGTPEEAHNEALWVYSTLVDGAQVEGPSSKSEAKVTSADVTAVLQGLSQGLPLPAADQETLPALARILQVEVGVAATLLHSIFPARQPTDSPFAALMTLARCAALAKRLGVGAETLKFIISDDYDELELACTGLLGAIQAKYGAEKDCRAQVRPIEDRLRSRTRDFLCDFLLQLGRYGVLKPYDIKTMNDLYQTFLIDVELAGCARTSRVVAAISSVQLYIQRLLLNLEPVVSQPKPEMAREWEWRKNYRVWEANRKVFLHPENYLEPDLRDDKTPLFKELEAKLLQQQITQQNVLDAYTSYLNGFEEVARLKIAGSYHDIGATEDTLHLFGVTPDSPPTYYYRGVNNVFYHGPSEGATRGIDWSHWRKIEVQIPVRQVAPVVYLGRLFVFWVEFTTTPKNDVSSGASSFVGYKHRMTLKYTSLRLDGTWTPPQPICLKDPLIFPTGEGVVEDPLSKISVTGNIDHSIEVYSTALEPFEDKAFTPADLTIFTNAIQSLVEAKKNTMIPRYDTKAHVEDLLDFTKKPQEKFSEFGERAKAIKAEPQDGYTLTGFQWDQVYPSICGEDLVVTGRNFLLRAPIDFYKKAITSASVDKVTPPVEIFPSLRPPDIFSGNPEWRYYISGYSLIPMPDNMVLGFSGDGGRWQLFTYDPKDKNNIFPDPPIKNGKWDSINQYHTLIPMPDGKVLDWVADNGTWRLWNYDPTQPDILPEPQIAGGTWETIRSGHTLIPMPDGKVLDWVAADGTWRLWQYDHTDKDDIFPGEPIWQGQWPDIQTGHRLIPLQVQEHTVLDWVAADGTWRLWRYDSANPEIFSRVPVATGQWETFQSVHTLIPMPHGYVLDWDGGDGVWRLWQYTDPSNARILSYTDINWTHEWPLHGYASASIFSGWKNLDYLRTFNDGNISIPKYKPHKDIAEPKVPAELAVINGSLEDGIIDFKGDLFLLQCSRKYPISCRLKRLGTTLSGTLLRKLFTGGVNALLDITTQKDDLKEQEPPFFLIPPTTTTNLPHVDEETEQNMIPGPIDFKHGPYGVYYREIFFHIPYLIANHLNSQGRFADAQRWYHYLFNPTAIENTDPPQDRNWRYLEFRDSVFTLLDILTDPDTIGVYKQDPFNPHAIARLRFSAYQKCIVMKYIDNLLDWADSLFAQFTRESVNEATMLYIMAAEILGPRPPELGDCGTGGLKPMNYETIAPWLGGEEKEFLIDVPEELETRALQKTYSGKSKQKLSYQYALPGLILASVARLSGFPPAAGKDRRTVREGIFKAFDWKKTPVGSGSRHLGVQDSPLIQDPDLIADFSASFMRLGQCPPKIQCEDRSNMHPLFCIPVNKELLGYWDRVEDRLYKIRHCLDIDGVRRDLALFAPEIDPRLLVQMKAAGLTLEDVLGAGSGNLPPYRFTYLIEKAKQYAGTVQNFGAALLSALEKKDVEQLNNLRTVHEQNILKLTRQIKQWEIDAEAEALLTLERQKESLTYRRDYYQGLIDQGLIPWERTQQISQHSASTIRIMEGTLAFLSGTLHLVPQLGSPFAMKYGGQELGNSSRAFAVASGAMADIASSIAASAGLEATFQRRDEEWKHQVELAGRELKQLDRQIAAAQFRQKIMNRAMQIHDKSIEQANEVYDYYAGKFSNFGLYTWLANTLQTLYRDAYNSALAMARLAEQAYCFERDDDNSMLLDTNYWEASRAGLLAGERLLIALQNLERKYIETNYRTFEIEQSFSLAHILPEALINLRETGDSDAFTIPEICFDLIYPGQYRRLIKSVRLSIPCVTGPYANVGATLRLQGSKLRTEPKINVDLQAVPLQRSVCIATSRAQNDAGVFELNFHDERYMPFEGAGAVESTWKLEMPKKLRAFDYNTISDVILHISYTAKDGDGGSTFKDEVETAIINKLTQGNIYRLLSLKHEFQNVLYKLLYPSGAAQPAEFDLGKQHFPYFLTERTLNLKEATFYLKPINQRSIDTAKLTLNVKLVDASDISEGNISTWKDLGKLKYGQVKKPGGDSLSGNPRNKWKIETTAGKLDPETLEDILILLTYYIL